MPAKIINISVERGDSLRIEFTLDKEDTIEVGDAFFTVRKYITDKDFILQKTKGNGITKDEGEPNSYIITLLPTETRKMELGKYYYDIEIVMPHETGAADDVCTIAKGTFEVLWDITRHSEASAEG